MIKTIGVFNTPTGITRFGAYPVFDLRQEEVTSPAEWAVLENEAVVCFVLLATAEPAIGSYVAGSAGLKWNLSINLREDVRMLAMWAGADVSRTGCHGTQQYAYLATDLRGCPASQIASRVKTGMVGMGWIVPAKKKQVFIQPTGYAGSQKIGEVEVFYTPSYSYRMGYNDKKGSVYGTKPSRAGVVVEGITHEIGTKFDVLVLIAKIRELLPVRSFELDEALLSEEFLRSGFNIEVVRALVQLYQAQGRVADTGLCADYAERKAVEVADEGVMFDLSGHFRRMGASRNGDLWVICPDGSLREPDELVRRKDYPEGNKRWFRVEAEELAVSWHVGLLRDIYAGSLCEVLHEPVSGRTQPQIDALRHIEEEIGVKTGSFGSFFDRRSLPGRPIATPAVEENGLSESEGPLAPASASALAALATRFAK